MKTVCGTCVAWVKTNGDQGECHFAPPQAVFMGFRPPALAGGQPQPMIAGVFPAVGAVASCRQWAQALAPAADAGDIMNYHAVPERAGPPTPSPRIPHRTYKGIDGVWACKHCNITGDQLETEDCK